MFKWRIQAVKIKWQDFIEERKKPVLKGTRLTVEFILKQLGAGMNHQGLLDQYPTLKPDHLRAAVLYAADVNRQTSEYVSFPFPCLNCDEPIPGAELFCSECCTQEAEYVRYSRACIADERSKREDVQEALKIKLAHILGGGYPRSLRQVPDDIRSAVIERDQGQCRKCGGPANQIDHICGNENTLDNLQLLCSKCHNKKTTAGFTRITPETNPEEWKKAQSLHARVRAPKPTRLCDGSDWKTLWRVVQKARRDALKNVCSGERRQEPVG